MLEALTEELEVKFPRIQVVVGISAYRASVKILRFWGHLFLHPAPPQNMPPLVGSSQEFEFWRFDDEFTNEMLSWPISIPVTVTAEWCNAVKLTSVQFGPSMTAKHAAGAISDPCVRLRPGHHRT